MTERMIVDRKIRSVSDPSTTLRVVLSVKSKDDGSAWCVAHAN
jgi:hypothetical protein